MVQKEDPNVAKLKWHISEMKLTFHAQTDSEPAAWLETRTMDAVCRPRTLRPATTARDTHARKRTTSGIKENLAKRIASIKKNSVKLKTIDKY